MSETFEQRTDRRLDNIERRIGHMEQRLDEIAERTGGIPALVNRVLEIGGPIITGDDE
jgi:hypothetical protein